MGSREQPADGQSGGSKVLEDFLFIPVTQSQAKKGRGVSNTLVRARVTQIRHAQTSAQRHSKNLNRWAIRPYAPPKPSSSKGKNWRSSAAETSEESTGSTPNSADKEEVTTFSYTTTEVCVRSRKVVPRASRVVPSPDLLDDSAQFDPFWTYPVEYDPSLPILFAHYIQNIAVPIASIDGPHEKNLFRRKWFPMAMTDAATMYAILLMAGSHYCIDDPANAKSIDLVRLKGRALSEINTALGDPSRATTDALIGAVAKMAAYEAIFGDSGVYAAHMRGLRMMLRMRGGLGELGLNGMLERLLVWIDYNAAHVTGVGRYLGGEDMPTVVELDGPDPAHFAGVS